MIDLDSLPGDLRSTVLIPPPGRYILRVKHVEDKQAPPFPEKNRVFLEDVDHYYRVSDPSRLWSQFRILLGPKPEEWIGQEVLALCAIGLTRNGKWHEVHTVREATRFVAKGWRPSLLVKRIIGKE